MMVSMMMGMAKNRIRALPLAAAAAAVTRTFMTAPSSGANKRLYRQLSALDTRSGGSVEKLMDEWVKEGKTVTESKLVNNVKELRRYKNYKHA